MSSYAKPALLLAAISPGVKSPRAEKLLTVWHLSIPASAVTELGLTPEQEQTLRVMPFHGTEEEVVEFVDAAFGKNRNHEIRVHRSKVQDYESVGVNELLRGIRETKPT
jgi:hypothetical protein